MSTENNQSSGRLFEQTGQGEDQLYVLKRGTILIPSEDFSGSPPRAQWFDTVKVYSVDATTEPLHLSYDVYQYVAGSDPADMVGGLESAVIKCPYSYSQQRAVCWFGLQDTVGTGFQLQLWVDYTADGSTGTPFSADRDQLFYYIVYSQAAIPGNIIPGEELP